MSRRFWFYLILVGITFALYSFSAMSQLLFLLILLLALPFCSLFLLFIGRYFVKVSIRAEKSEVYRLEPFRIFLDIENNSPFFFPLIRIEFNHPAEQAEFRPLKDWTRNRSLDGSAYNDEVHFFNEYAYDDLANEDDQEISLAPSGGNYLDNRRVLRLYPYPHLSYVRSILTAVLPQHSTSHQVLHLSARRKGSYQVGTSSILLQDLFGFFYLPLPMNKRIRGRNPKDNPLLASIDVLPNPLRWKSPSAGKLQSPEQVLQNVLDVKVSNEVDTLANVREYRPGDRIKQIHWKLSARQGNLLAREFEDPRQGGILFILDPKLPDDCVSAVDYANEATEIIASVMKLLSKTEGPLSLILGETLSTAPGEGLEPLTFYRQMMLWQPQIRPDDRRLSDSLTASSCLVTAHRLELSTLLHKESRRQRYRAIVVVTARMNDQLSSELNRVQKQGSQLLVVFLHNEGKAALNDILQPLSHSSIRLFPTRLQSLSPYAELPTSEKAVSAGTVPDPRTSTNRTAQQEGSPN